MPKRRDSSAQESQPIELRPFPGHPGYRNRPGRTGLDPLDNYREEGFFLGSVMVSLAHGRALTRNPFLAGCMLLVGVLLLGLGLLSFTVPYTVSGFMIFYLPALLWFVILGVIGFLCIVNASLSIRDISHGQADSEDEHPE